VADETSDVILRPLAPGDVAAVAGFEREIATISFPDDPVTDLRFYEKKLRAAIEDRRADALVAEKGGALVGWAWLAERENFTTRERYGDLRSFYVAPAQRGAGVAFALMRACIARAEARGLARVVGRTAAANDAMQALYALYDFAPRHVVYELPLGRSSEGAPERPAAPARFSPAGRARRRGPRSGGSRGA